ncbi:ATP-binding protein [Streptomyces sp. NPDC002490]|uniref:ATP-binding protein n=1 Tax=Streptomyces sp. NPDC002490 TaxID=3154416 RepID=UPI0033339AF7
MSVKPTSCPSPSVLPSTRRTGPAPCDPRSEPGFEVALSRATRPAGVDRVWPGLLRRAGNACLDEWGVRGAEAARDDFGLLLTELVTNGFQHGHGPTVRVRVWRTGRHLGIEVAGSGPAGTSPATADPADPLAESGRGLHLVGAFADTWGVSPDRTATWCLLPLG